jgi:hypothetical protein
VLALSRAPSAEELAQEDSRCAVIAEIIACAAGSAAGQLAWSYLTRKSAPVKEPEDTRIAFNGAWRKLSVKTKDRPFAQDLDVYGYRCPACAHDVGREQWTPKFCECPEHPKPHFHFACSVCGLKAMMKPAALPDGVAP